MSSEPVIRVHKVGKIYRAYSHPAHALLALAREHGCDATIVCAAAPGGRARRRPGSALRHLARNRP